MPKRLKEAANTNAAADPFTVLRPRLVKALSGLSPELPADWHERDLESHGRPPREAFPVPDLVLFALRNVLGFPWAGHGEKVRWSVFGSFTRIPVSLEMRKFGFTICAAKGSKIDLKRLCGQLQVAVKHVEDWLAPLAKAQASVGNVTVANRYGQFDERYTFFRKLADRSYRRGNTKSRRKASPKRGRDTSTPVDLMLDHWSHSMRAKTEGFYYSTAMVDAYFSRLEHILVLLRAFSGETLQEGELNAFLAMRWDEKVKALFDVDEAPIQKLYSGLKQIKERVRNPFAHGGVENDGGSLFVHIPTIGAVPGNFTQIRNSVQFNFIPVEQDDHGAACTVFDAFDQAIRGGTLAGAYSFIENGVDPSFSAEKLKIYKELAEGAVDRREAWLQHWHYENDRHANMDY